MNLGTMKTALKRIAGVDSTDPLTDWINAALHEFEEAYPWPFLEWLSSTTTTPGSNNLSLPADFFKFIKIQLFQTPGAFTDPVDLKPIPYNQFIEEGYQAGDTGVPQVYTQLTWQGILIWPLPLLTYNVNIAYVKSVADLVLDADVPGIPARYHYTVVQGAAIRALEAESEEDRAQTYRGIFEDAIDRHITAIGGKRQEGSFNTVRDVMGYGS